MLTNNALLKGRVLSLSSTNRQDLVAGTQYQVVYVVLEPTSDAAGILLNPQRGSQNPLLLYVPITGEEQLMGAMLTLPGISSVLRFDPPEAAVFDWPTAASQVLWTPTGATCLLGDILDANNYAPPVEAVPPPVAPIPPLAPVQPLPPPPPVQQFTDYSQYFPKGRVFKIDSPEPQYAEYLNVAFEAVSANPKGVIGRAEDNSVYQGKLVFFPFTEGFNPLLDPPGSFQFTTKVTQQSEVCIPGQTETAVYNDFWADPYWGFGVEFGPIILY